MKINLHLNGRDVTFPSEELMSRLKRLEEIEEQIIEDEVVEEGQQEIALKPTEGKYFKVNPKTINTALFEEERDDFMQEWTRKAILLALEEVEKNPRRYKRNFATFIPRKNWKSKTVRELKAVANTKGDHIANWVEQALEWAQRITNGEPWTTICNEPDSSKWYRLVIWRNHHTQIVGGSRMCNDILPATTVFGNTSEASDILHFTVPLIVIYV